MIPIVYIFIVLVIAYLTVGLFKVPKRDVIFIGIAVVILVVTMLKGHFFQSKTEHYVDADMAYNLDNLKPIELEEDITPISEKLVVYNTAFNKISYNENGNSWLNMIVTKDDGTCDTNAANSIFNFELPPVYSRKSGFYMGNNRLVGPYSNAMNIQFHNTFTIMLVCKHGNLLVDQVNSEIELIKLYANSPNNNGLSLYIQRNSLRNENNVQVGKLMLQYSNREPMQCVLPNNEFLSFEKDIYTFYFIIKGTDHIRVAMMTEKNTNVDPLLWFNVENSDVTFSNKEFVMNRLKNWNGHVYGLGIYSVALSDDDLTSVYAHLVSEYMKYANSNYISTIQQYNDTLSLLRRFISCPYSQDVCSSCSTVDKWNSMEQLLGASAQCKSAINEFCMGNINHPLCKCWNSQNTTYNSDSCKMFRGIFNEMNSFLDNLNQTDIDYIMKKYGLIRPDDCPKAIKTPTFLKNAYNKYDYEKLKVYLPDSDKDKISRVQKVYEAEPDDGAEEEDYNWNKLKIKYDPNMKTSESTQKLSEKDLQISNYYKSDPQMNFKLSSEAQKYEELVKKEQEKLMETKDLNIVPDAPTEKKQPSKIIAYHKQFFDGSGGVTPVSSGAAATATAALTASTSGTTTAGTTTTASGSGTAGGDSFFSRFMQITMPN